MEIKTAPQLYLNNCLTQTYLIEPTLGKYFSANTLLQPFFLEIIQKASNWIALEKLSQYLKSLAPTLSPQQIKDAIIDLVQHGFFVERQNHENNAKKCELQQQWRNHGWEEALHYHTVTNVLKKMDYTADPKGLADKAIMRQYLQEESMPNSYKDYSHVELIKLKKAADVKITTKSLTEIFVNSVTTQEQHQAISLDELSWYTHLAFGQTRVKKLPITREHVAKTVPSGGSRHPIEIYLITLENNDMPQGLYHYNVRHHELELLRAGNHQQFLTNHVITLISRVKFTPRIVFLFTCIFERSMFRYREARSYRVMQYDLGHLLQNAVHLASARSRPTYRGYTFHDAEVEQFLGIDGLLESSMAYLLLG